MLIIIPHLGANEYPKSMEMRTEEIFLQSFISSRQKLFDLSEDYRIKLKEQSSLHQHKNNNITLL